MFDLHELSTEEDEPVGKIDELIATLKEKDTDNLEEVSDDDATIVLNETDEDESSEEKKGNIPSLFKRDRRTSRTSTTSNKSTSKGVSDRTKQPSESSAKVSKVDVNLNTSVEETATKQRDETDKLQNHSEVKVVRRGRQVLAPNVKPQTTRFLRKQTPSASLSLPEANKTVASSFSSLPEKKFPRAEKKPSEESIVEKRGRRADTVQPSTSKPTKQQSESDDEEEEEEPEQGQKKSKKFKEMVDRMGSAVILLQRVSPLIIARVAGKRKSSFEEKGASSSVKSPVSDEDVTSKLGENNLPEVELILSLDEIGMKSTKTYTRRRKAVGLSSANKRPRISETIVAITSTSSDSDDSVFFKDHSAVTDQQAKSSSRGDSSSNNEEKEKDSSSKMVLPTAQSRRGRPRKSVTPVPTNKKVSKGDPILPADQPDKVVGPKSKKALIFPAESKPKVRSKSSDESDEEEASTPSKPSVEELASEATDVEFFAQNGYSSSEDSSPKGKSSTRGRGRAPKKAASKSAISSDPLLAGEIDDKQKKPLTRPMVKKRPVVPEKLDVMPQKKKRLYGEKARAVIVESDNEVEDLDKSEDANDIQQEVLTSVVRRGRGRTAKAAISPEKTIEKSPVVPGI